MNNVSLKNESNCVGCGACSQICPKNCIEMKKNEHGFLVPIVDKKKCIECGACINSCPMARKLNLNKCLYGYAAISKSKKILNRSTSGGVFSEICDWIINRNGIVYGASWDNNLNVNHIRISKIEDVEKLNQSKYIQSNINDTYKLTKQDLDNDILVLFSGTACQIAGLKSFLKKDYENLYTVEVVCHGTPSQGLFDKYILWLEKKYNKKIIKFSFRNKEKHKTGEHFMFNILFEDKTQKYLYANEDPYYFSFLSSKILRKSCYNCKFKDTKRISDFTLGDFWGIEKYLKTFPARNGVSAVLVNSEKAMILYEQIKENLISEQVDVNFIFNGNKSLIRSADLKNFVEYDVNNQFIFDNLKPKFNLKNKLKNCIPDNVKYVLKRVK